MKISYISLSSTTNEDGDLTGDFLVTSDDRSGYVNFQFRPSTDFLYFDVDDVLEVIGLDAPAGDYDAEVEFKEQRYDISTEVYDQISAWLFDNV